VLLGPSQHSPDLTLSNILFQIAPDQRIPPFKQHALADQPEPRRELEILALAQPRLRLPEQLLQLFLAHPCSITHLVHINVQIRLRFNEENVVNLVLPPFPIRGREIVYPCQELKIRNGNLLGLYAEFVAQLPLARAFRTLDVGRQVAIPRLGRMRQGMRTARVRPHVGEGDLLAGALLQQQFVRLGMEEEDAEGAVEETVVDVGHEVAGLFGGGADRVVVGVEDDANFVHEADLFGVVAGEVIVLVGRVEARGGSAQIWVHFREKVEDVLRGDGSSGRRGRGGRHGGWNGEERRKMGLELLNF
jgi:hypothetical protein